MTQNIKLFNKEIQPIIRAIDYQKALLKDFKESDEDSLVFAEDIKIAQQSLKDYLQSNDVAGEILNNIKNLEANLKEAVASAADGSEYEPATLKKYYVTRSKDKVDVVINTGTVFSQLDTIVEG